MKKVKFLFLSLIAAVVAVVAVSCGSDTLISEDTTPTVAITGDTETTEETPRITITVASTSGDDLTYTRATRADDDDTTSDDTTSDDTTSDDTTTSSSEIQTEDEKEIVELHIYIFELSEGATDSISDGSYVYYNKWDFTAGEGITDESGNTVPTEDTYIDDGNGNKECYIEIITEMLGKYVKIVMLANDEPTETLTQGTTTLSDFKTYCASATVSDKDHADALVGYPDDGATGYPMSATALVADDGGQSVELTVLGVDMTATLTRTMARLDVFNWIPNLTIQNVYVTNTPNMSYLFPQYEIDGTDSTAVYAYPTGSSLIQINPLLEYCDDNGDFEDTAFDATGEYTTDAVARANNTIKHVLYMYEQPVTSTSDSPVVSIDYMIDLNINEKYGTVQVPFITTDDDGTETPVDVVRNHRYTIRLGDGDAITGTITAQFIVDDWETGDTIYTELSASEDIVTNEE